MPRPIQRPSSPKKAVQPAKLNESAIHAKFALSASSMPLLTTSDLVSGAASLSVNAAV